MSDRDFYVNFKREGAPEDWTLNSDLPVAFRGGNENVVNFILRHILSGSTTPMKPFAQPYIEGDAIYGVLFWYTNIDRHSRTHVWLAYFLQMGAQSKQWNVVTYAIPNWICNREQIVTADYKEDIKARHGQTIPAACTAGLHYLHHHWPPTCGAVPDIINRAVTCHTHMRGKQVTRTLSFVSTTGNYIASDEVDEYIQKLQNAKWVIYQT